MRAPAKMQRASFWPKGQAHNKKGDAIPPSNMSKFKYRLSQGLDGPHNLDLSTGLKFNGDFTSIS